MAKLVAATHSGGFHADDVFAAAVLDLTLGLGIGFTLVRTRDPKIIGQADIVFDVGGIFDPERSRFDHHQRGYAEKRPNGVPFSSFGLLWRQLGTDACHAVLGAKSTVLEAGKVAEVVDIELVQGVDAMDCGAQEFLPRGGNVRIMSLSAMIGGFNPGWQEVKQDFDSAFIEATAVARRVLTNIIKSSHDVIAAENKVLEAKAEGSILLLENFYPWQIALFKRKDADSLRYVVFPNVSGGWRVQAVSTVPHSFSMHKPLPESWRGLEGEVLDAVTGIPGGIFCHASGFIGGHATREGALALARAAIEA
ncbi:MAG: MYG1 family protein [Betaproteobacteria bacterium]|nr:MYG1 family protein [Betaproteobacteria bacterium]